MLIITLGIVSIPILGRITRANTLQWSQREFVLGLTSQGATDRRVMVREVLPERAAGDVLDRAARIAVAIVAEGGLSILGVGVHLPGVSWGNLIAAAPTAADAAVRSCSSRSSASSSPCSRSTISATSCGRRFDVRESAL